MVKSPVNSNEVYYIFNAECHVSDCSVQHCAIGTIETMKIVCTFCSCTAHVNGPCICRTTYYYRSRMESRQWTQKYCCPDALFPNRECWAIHVPIRCVMSNLCNLMKTFANEAQYNLNVLNVND